MNQELRYYCLRMATLFLVAARSVELLYVMLGLVVTAIQIY